MSRISLLRLESRKVCTKQCRKSEIIATLILLHDSHIENLCSMGKGLGEEDLYLFLAYNDLTLLYFCVGLIQSQ